MIDDPELEERLRRGAVAEAEMRRNALVLSGHRYAPKIVWALKPHSDADLRRLVEADGLAPFKVLSVLPLDRRALRLPGAPVWAQWAALVMVEVRGTFGGAE